MKKKKNYYARIAAALLLLCNPNIHLLDFLPDFIAYFLLFSVISEAADLAPHFAQARDLAKKLALLGLFKIPAVFIILVSKSGNTMDSNLVPTFAIIFALFEMILGYLFIYHTSEALFYLGERSDAAALISSFRAGKHRKVMPEILRNLSYCFFFAKSFASFIPELLLLTRKQDFVGDLAGQMALVRLYPYALLIVLLPILALGIYWLLNARAYLRAIQTEGKFSSALYSLAGEDMILQKEKHALCAASVLAFTLFSIATLFSMNFMPLFCYALFLVLGACWLKTPKSLARKTHIFGALAIVTTLAQMLSVEIFEYDYGYDSLLNNAEAKAAYIPVVISAAINTIALLTLLFIVYLCIRHVIYNSLDTSAASTRTIHAEKKYHRELARFNVIFLILGALSVICRGIYIYLRGQVIFIPSSATAVGTISHKLEFWPLILILIAIPYIIFTFYMMGMMKDEIKMATDEF